MCPTTKNAYNLAPKNGINSLPQASLQEPKCGHCVLMFVFSAAIHHQWEAEGPPCHAADQPGVLILLCPPLCGGYLRGKVQPADPAGRRRRLKFNLLTRQDGPERLSFCTYQTCTLS